MATILCDLDGTLLVKVRPDPPGAVSPKRAAVNLALAEVLGLPAVDFVQGIEHGLTDWQISERAAQFHRPQTKIDGIAWHAICLRAEAVFRVPAAGRTPFYRRLPGVPATLQALRAAGHRLGLVTGNMAFAAVFKLLDAGIDRGLFDGPLAFGDHGRERTDLLRVALAWSRPAAGGAGGASGDRAVRDDDAVVVLGDTLHDRAAALAVGLPFLGTGTMGLERQEVLARDAEAAEDPHTAWVPDLGDAAVVLRAVTSLLAP
jgi:phosphoglycolate phosphatase-like HAD superfamily hydrolase